MNCCEARDLLPMFWDLPMNHPQKEAVMRHIESCEECAAEWKVWEESCRLIHTLEEEAPVDQAERVNLNVMNRIYAESPWLLPANDEALPFARRFKRHMKLWVAGFMALFLCSFFVMMNTYDHDSAATPPVSGLLPTAIAGAESSSSSEVSIELPMKTRGLIDPLVVNMGPAHPGYWMILSLIGMIIALVSWRWIYRLKH
ncbi:zf-HC2 domain-containing protein [Paenibacillus sediminis]|uniref:Zf-HC2 domain-containing protein n=1 Tax=Paenibacillus sediminis TaxID=664909 RepID=A0ABS4GZS4_9BACL|nr:zf-HC2 domain-containing protein [Paenibacillus sediminis]MBP1935777.1 hypothetical protein [Paenibacillus sediminis]